MTTLIFDIYCTLNLFGINVLWFLSTLIGARIICKVIFNSFQKSSLIALSFLFYVMTWFISRYIPSQPIGITKIWYYPIVSIIRMVMMSSFLLLGYSIKKIYKAIENSNIIIVSILFFMCFSILLYFSYYFYENNLSIDYHLLIVDSLLINYFSAFIGLIFTLCLSKIIIEMKEIKKLIIYFGGKEISHKLYTILLIFLLMMVEILLIILSKIIRDKIKIRKKYNG